MIAAAGVVMQLALGAVYAWSVFWIPLTISIANGSGRFLWAWLSDFIGRNWVFLTMFLVQAVVFFLLPWATSLGRGRDRRADADRQDPRVHRRVQHRALCDLGDHAGQRHHPVHRPPALSQQEAATTEAAPEPSPAPPRSSTT